MHRRCRPRPARLTARLGLVREPRHVGRDVLLLERAEGLGPGLEGRERPALVVAHLRARAHRQRRSVITPSVPSEPTTTSRRSGPAALPGAHRQRQRWPRAPPAHAEHELVDAPVAGRGLAGRARGDQAAELAYSHDCGKWPSVRPRSSSAPLDRRAAHARARARPSSERSSRALRPDEPPQVERDHRPEVTAQRLDPADHARPASERHDGHAGARRTRAASRPPAAASPGTTRRRAPPAPSPARRRTRSG